MLPKNKKLVCNRCGAEKEISNTDEFKLKSKEKGKSKILILEEEDIRTLPTTRVECKRCGNMEAEWWLLQTRKADEAETRFFRCTKCKFTWREYS
jgi:DNA-directed RNA polymerase subunit M